MVRRRTRGAYRKEDRARLAPELQKELVEKAAARYGTCERLAKALEIPKSSVHYYRTARLTMPVSLLEKMLEAAHDEDLGRRVRDEARIEDRTWANAYAGGIYREQCRQRVRLPTDKELEGDDDLKRKAAAIVSYVMAEGSIWTREDKDGESIVNITFADHETDLYEHFRSLCKDVFSYDIGPPQAPGNYAKAIRGFIYSRFVAEWLIANGVLPGEKAAQELHLPRWVIESDDWGTWTASLQPWFDGEGSILGGHAPGWRRWFRVHQSRHTGLTTDILPGSFRRQSEMTVCKAKLKEIRIELASALEHCRTHCRSEILDDVALLARKLGMSPVVDVVRLALKQDGSWSCVWSASFSATDSALLVRRGVVTQERKRSALSPQLK